MASGAASGAGGGPRRSSSRPFPRRRPRPAGPLGRPPSRHRRWRRRPPWLIHLVLPEPRRSHRSGNHLDAVAGNGSGRSSRRLGRRPGAPHRPPGRETVPRPKNPPWSWSAPCRWRSESDCGAVAAGVTSAPRPSPRVLRRTVRPRLQPMSGTVPVSWTGTGIDHGPDRPGDAAGYGGEAWPTRLRRSAPVRLRSCHVPFCCGSPRLPSGRLAGPHPSKTGASAAVAGTIRSPRRGRWSLEHTFPLRGRAARSTLTYQDTSEAGVPRYLNRRMWTLSTRPAAMKFTSSEVPP
jgi:hypothetical protein